MLDHFGSSCQSLSNTCKEFLFIYILLVLLRYNCHTASLRHIAYWCDLDIPWDNFYSKLNKHLSSHIETKNRWMDKVGPIYDGIWRGHEKEQNWVICSGVDEPRVCLHTEWSKSERDRQISHINSHMWNLEKQYRWTYL